MNCPKCGKEIPSQKVQCSCGFYVGNQSLYIEYKTTVQPKAKEEPIVYATPIAETAEKVIKAEKVEKEKKPVKKSNGISVAALIFAFLIPPLGLLFGIIGLIIGCKREGVGRGRSIAALVISTMMIATAFGFLYFIGQKQYGFVKGWLKDIVDIFF